MPQCSHPAIPAAISSQHLQFLLPLLQRSTLGPTGFSSLPRWSETRVSHQSECTIYIYVRKREGEKPWHCGVYWLSIKWALSDDRDVIYEAEGETLWLSYVRTSLRMKAAHTERADSSLPLSPRLGAGNWVWRTRLKRAANLWTVGPCQSIGQPWPVYLGLTVVAMVRDQWRYAEQMQKFNDKYDTVC